MEAEQKDIYFRRSLSVLPKQNTSSFNVCCPRGERKAILIYFSLAPYFLRSVSVLLKSLVFSQAEYVVIKRVACV